MEASGETQITNVYTSFTPEQAQDVLNYLNAMDNHMQLLQGQINDLHFYIVMLAVFLTMLFAFIVGYKVAYK